ncbi:RsmD family RNA methyltransferase [Taibaiella koreensis]|uniref:RsmD family RNA methyltransferase n=1 Tax=Taibaiella koreensis TaxID=1268548 RepID=UPI000E5A0D9C|nr:RsmD family RNA methyltransferase [Taibaiella koreensis]
MRIISGTHGGRKIHPPTNMPHTRPTTDVAKEGLFNILQNQIDFEGIRTLDIFGGTGSISYELASRGAADLTIIERDKNMAAFIRKTAAEFGFSQIKLLQVEVFKFLKSCIDQYDFIFAGPPYALVEIDAIPDLIFEKNLLLPDGLFILEHTPRNNYEEHPRFLKVKNYGTTLFSFFGYEEES